MLPLLLLASLAAGFAQTAPAGEAPLQIELRSYRPDDRLAIVPVGTREGVAVGDRAWLLAGEDVIAAGQVNEAAASTATISFHFLREPKRAERAVILRGRDLVLLRSLLPPDVPVRGRVSRLGPGRQTAWLDFGSSAGVRIGDEVLIRRAASDGSRRVLVPIARGQIRVLSGDVALTTLRPLVANAVTELGDTAELWPAPGEARWNRVNSAVLATRPAPEGDQLTLVGTADDGLYPPRLIDLFRDGSYLGIASLTSADGPLARAQVMPAASREPVREADEAIVRAPMGPIRAPLRAPIFRLAPEDYCLIAAGEMDGLQRGEKLSVRREDPETGRFVTVAELTLDKIEVSYSGGLLRMVDPIASPVELWEFAERQDPPWPRWIRTGMVAEADPPERLLVADVNPDAVLTIGSVVRLLPARENESPAAGIVIGQEGESVVVYVPPVWGEPAQLEHARLDAVDTPLTPRLTTRPAPTGPGQVFD